MKRIGTKTVCVKDLKKYNLNSLNRRINQSHVNKLKKSILNAGMVIQAIIINIITNNLCDGQHRREALLQLLKEGKISPNMKVQVIIYEMDPNEEIDFIRTLQDGRAWTGQETFISEYNRGNEHVINLDKFARSHSLLFGEKGAVKSRYAYSMLTGKDDSTTVKTCSYKFTDDDFKRGHEVHEEINKILSVLDFRPDYWLSRMIIVWYRYRNTFTFKEWIKNIRAIRKGLQHLPHTRMTDWENIFSTVYARMNGK